jgi:hypothetical protein
MHLSPRIGRTLDAPGVSALVGSWAMVRGSSIVPQAALAGSSGKPSARSGKGRGAELTMC